MKYFTPELYLRYNSSDDRDADLAEDAWELAIERYKRYLKEHRSKMPPNVRELAEKCCFHDAALLGWQSHEPSDSRSSASRRVLTLGLQQESEMVVLYYFLCDSPKESKRPKNWPFSQQHKHWLYDEVGVDGEVAFAHRILWSDGSELEIPFTELMVDRFPALSPAAV